MQRELDFTKAFERARGLFTGNLQLLLAVAGVFFVIPQFLLGFISGSIDGLPTGYENATTFEEFVQILSDFFSANIVWFVLSTVASFIGTLTVLVILLDKSRPTVGQAIGIALGLLVPYFILSILVALATTIGLLFLIIPGIYFAIKLYLAPSIMVAEKQTNPIDAMKASWNLTKGNSLRIFFFLLIIVIVISVISLLVSAVATLAVAGALAIGLIINGVFTGVVTVFNIAIAAAIYQELRGPMTEDLTATFD